MSSSQTTNPAPARHASQAAAALAAAQPIAVAYHLLDTLPVAEAARRAFTPTGPPLVELEARIVARRAGTARAAA
ncbi:hypothetical protein [Oerskovia jenensis]|uniref:hypothetical protein n=1 Tax=Oerskovia jenensis TaxID=162169 RepID=UPI0036D94958